MSGHFSLSLACVLLLCATVSPVTAASDRDDVALEGQRMAFRAVYPQAELGIRDAALSQASILESYVLWPDLHAAYFKARIKGPHFNVADETAVLDYLERFGSLRPGRDLRYAYAVQLAEIGRLADFLGIYRQYYQGLDVPKLDCFALQAEILAGRQDRVVNRAISLWLVGQSQDKACDPVFDHLRGNGLLSAEHFRERYELAIDAREFTLARYLAGPLEPAYRDEATRWISARDNPSGFIAAHRRCDNSPQRRQQLLYALEQIAYRDPESAAIAWQDLRSHCSFSGLQIAAISRHIALWLARRHTLLAHDALASLPREAVDTEVLRWMARTSLRRHDWHGVIDSIAAMPRDEQSREEWQYWHARALRGIAQEDHALSMLHQLSGERSYYGFLAADDLDLQYTFAHSPTEQDDEVLAALESSDALVRARELFFVGMDSRGRSEWDAVINNLDAHEKAQAALLAHRWGWHSRAIAAVASAGQYDDLAIRYPLAYEKSFERYAADAGIQASWAFGVARSESLFMSDVQSSAGAVGIMQLMPDTGRSTAGDIRLPYAGITTLVDPGSNIRLGTTYLGKMLKRFDSNPILATAAYNAGPAKVASWLPVADNVDARIWIENIPYNETRNYVRRVLATETIFHWRMTGETRRISSGLQDIVAIQPTTPIASNIQ
jgi:soluble lytic murein transglycosylase